MAQKRPNRIPGAENDEFWSYCNKSELRLQSCGKCGHITWPAGAECENCGSKDLKWTRMSGRGKVISWTLHEREYYKGVIPIPWPCILVELVEGPLFLSNPKGFSYNDIKPYMSVKLSFLDVEDQKGAFKLPVFEKA